MDRLITTKNFDKKIPSILEAMVAFMLTSQQESLKLDLSNTKKVIKQIIFKLYGIKLFSNPHEKYNSIYDIKDAEEIEFMLGKALRLK